MFRTARTLGAALAVAVTVGVVSPALALPAAAADTRSAGPLTVHSPALFDGSWAGQVSELSTNETGDTAAVSRGVMEAAARCIDGVPPLRRTGSGFRGS